MKTKFAILVLGLLTLDLIILDSILKYVRGDSGLENAMIGILAFLSGILLTGRFLNTLKENKERNEFAEDMKKRFERGDYAFDHPSFYAVDPDSEHSEEYTDWDFEDHDIDYDYNIDGHNIDGDDEGEDVELNDEEERIFWGDMEVSAPKKETDHDAQ